MIDLQVNGAGGHDLTEAPERVWDVGEVLTAYGVTAWLPTLVDPSWATVERARAALAGGPPPGFEGAMPLGWHVEGPFLARSRAGAHDPDRFLAPEVAPVADWSPATGIRIVTMAPELPGAIPVVERLVANGVVVSAGHSGATWAQAQAGFDAGIRMITHLFNAMARLDHREPGLPGAALADDRVTICVIPDGLHVHPGLIALVRRTIGAERLAVVTDAIAALGVAPGTHRLAGRKVLVDETSCRLPDGTLAGSLLGLETAVRNLADYAGISIDDARLAATRVPAQLLGIDWPIA